MGRGTAGAAPDQEFPADVAGTRFGRPAGRLGYRREALAMTRPVKGPKTPRPGTAGPRSTGRLQRAIDDVVKREIVAALSETRGNVVRAARVLGISQPGLYKRLVALGIDPTKYRV